jgi:diguanylate cyclase (GGDEF)-like protein/PAS domain S-box-containing protein
MLVTPVLGFTVQRLVEHVRASEARTRLTVDSAHEAFVAIDEAGMVTEWNAEAEAVFGWSRGEAVGRRLSTLIVPVAHREAHERGLERFRATGEGPILDRRLELTALHRDGHEFPVEATIAPLRIDGGVAFQAFLHDISARKRTEQYLAAQHGATEVLAQCPNLREAGPRLLQTLGESLGWHAGALWLVDTRANALRCAETWEAPGRAFPAFVPATRDALLEPGVSLAGRVWATGRPDWVSDIQETADFRQARAAAAEGLHAAICLPILSGGVVLGVIELFDCEARPPDAELVALMGNITAQVGQFMDRLARTEHVARVEAVARTDDLTGLANRRAWNEELPRQLDLARRARTPICVAIVDLDEFKSFNDIRGHQAGDRLLKEAGAAWRMQLRATDTLARYGGEEFAVLLPDCELSVATTVIERLRAATPAAETCSAGVAQWNGEETADELVARADVALYSAKAAGRDRTMTSAPAPAAEPA